MNVSNLGVQLVKVALVGRLDTTGVGRVETQFIARLVPGANSAIVDLSQVDFVSSLGLRMLVSAAMGLKTRQAKLVLYGVQRPVLQVFEAVALNKIMQICSDEADALAAIGSGTRTP
jgi:anti-sigma B factor antagonist